LPNPVTHDLAGGSRLPRVIVTGGQFPAALAALRSLARHGFSPVAVATTRGSYASFSRSVSAIRRVPDVSVSASRFVEGVAAICGDHDRVVLIPGTEPELVALVTWNHLLPPSVLGLPSPETLGRATDKVLLNELARAAGMQAPSSTLVGVEGRDTSALPFPGVIKPVRTVAQDGDTLASVSATPIAGPADLASFLARAGGGDALYQPLLSGDLYSLAGVMWRGKLRAPVLQVALSIFPEPCGGSAVARSVPVDESRVRQMEQVMNAMNWEGIVQLQWIRNTDGDFVIDVNPRIYGSIELANAAGCDLAAIWAKLLLGIPSPETFSRREVLYRNLETSRRPRKRIDAGSMPHAAVTANSVFAASDPLPVLASVIRGLRKVLRDVRNQPAEGTPSAAHRDPGVAPTGTASGDVSVSTSPDA
jgi:predicted ATP-grasp superfamily ATP-dependent carboligase